MSKYSEYYYLSIIAYHQIGTAFFNQHILDDTEKYFLFSLELSKKFNFHDKMGSIYFYRGMINKSKKRFNTAIYYLKKAQEWRKKTETKNHYEPSQIYLQIGRIYTEMQQMNLALHYYKKAINWKLKIDDYKGLKIIKQELFKLKELNKDFEELYAYIKLSLKLIIKNQINKRKSNKFFISSEIKQLTIL